MTPDVRERLASPMTTNGISPCEHPSVSRVTAQTPLPMRANPHPAFEVFSGDREQLYNELDNAGLTQKEQVIVLLRTGLADGTNWQNAEIAKFQNTTTRSIETTMYNVRKKLKEEGTWSEELVHMNQPKPPDQTTMSSKKVSEASRQARALKRQQVTEGLRGIDSLTFRDKELLSLRAGLYDDNALSLDEVADVLFIDRETVDSRCTLALKRLAKTDKELHVKLWRLIKNGGGKKSVGASVSTIDDIEDSN